MKNKIRLIVIVMILILLIRCEKEEQSPKIDIPDNNFLKALIKQGVDTNGDSFIGYAEAEAIMYLDVSGGNISNLAGIESFINLDSLDCSNNLLTSIDLQGNEGLTYLECSRN